MNENVWGMALVRPNTESTITVALPESLSSELDYVTVKDLSPEDTFEAIGEWLQMEFEGWEPVALLPKFNKVKK